VAAPGELHRLGLAERTLVANGEPHRLGLAERAVAGPKGGALREGDVGLDEGGVRVCRGEESLRAGEAGGLRDVSVSVLTECSATPWLHPVILAASLGSNSALISREPAVRPTLPKASSNATTVPLRNAKHPWRGKVRSDMQRYTSPLLTMWWNVCCPYE